MKKLFFMTLLLAACLIFAVSCTAPAVTSADSTDTQTAESSTEQTPITTEAEMGLTSNQAIAELREAVWNEYVSSLPESRATELQKNKITTFKVNGRQMKVQTRVIGKAPAGGYPIFIVLHGGGSDPTGEMNESQWSGMASRYANLISCPGIFVSCRAIEDTWNCHSVDGSYMFYDRIIENASIFLNGNPNRAYIVGYSAGGDGVYQIAPRMADRFAAANMTAGHPNGISMVNTYNLPFYLQVGELDTAYSRNTVTVEYAQLLDSLNQTYGGGYLHDVFVHVGKEHGVVGDNATGKQTVVDDTAAWLKAGGRSGVGGSVSETTHAGTLMSAHVRNPLPERVVWDLSCRTPSARRISSFYWLSAPLSVKSGILDISYDKATNTVTVNSCTVKTSGKITVYLNEEMVDLFKEVHFVFNGKTTSFMPELSEKLLEDTTEERGDRNFQFVAKFSFKTDGTVTVG